MAKIMLVEDDNNLREIYEARLLAEGYEIISAADGEAALALAVKEKPDLIISDIMMPKISGFDMLDILRSTPETKDTKIIMMTALSQAEDKTRADKLGADRYLVKSQVTLEDVAKVAREILGGEPASSSPLTDTAKPTLTDQAVVAEPPKSDPPATNPPVVPTTPNPAPVVQSVPPADSAAANSSPPATQTKAEEEAKMDEKITSFINSSVTPTDDKPTVDKTNDASADAQQLATIVNDVMNEKKAENPAPQPPQPTSPKSPTPEPPAPVGSKKIIQPINDIAVAKPNFQDLVAKEAAQESATKPTVITPASPPPVAPDQKPTNSDPNTISL